MKIIMEMMNNIISFNSIIKKEKQYYNILPLSFYIWEFIVNTKTMRFLSILLTLFSFAISFGQTIIKKEINSTEFSTKRNFKIFLPEGYKSDSLKKYPVAIVLDDGFLFDIYVGNSKKFAASDLAPKQIVIGLNTDFGINKDVSIVKNNGGLSRTAKKFYNYIKNEIVPYAEKNLETSPFLSIVGHGKAGNFITHFLKEINPIFNSYVAISPKFNKDTYKLFATYNLKRLDKIDNEFFLFISNNNVNTEQENNFISSLTEDVKKLETENLNLTYKNFSNSPNLPTSISLATPYAFSQMFNLYARISKEEYNEKIKDLSPLDAIKYVENKYLDIDYIYGTNLNVRLQDIYTIESIVMDQQDGDYLRVLGDFTMIKHPDSPLGDFYIGMFHEMGKNYEQADSYYKTGYGKMDPSDPNADAYYKNIERVAKLALEAPKDEEIPLEDIPLEDDIPNEEEQPLDENNNPDGE